MNAIKTALKVLLVALVDFVAEAALGAALPLSPGLSAVPEGERWMSLPGILLVGLVLSAVILYFCRRSSKRTPELAVLVALILFALNTVQTQVETWYFREAFPQITDRDLILLFVQGLLVSAIFAPAAVLLFRGRGSSPELGAPETGRDYRFERRWWKYALVALLYEPFYFGFGMLAQLAPVLGATYAGWVADERLVALLPLWQVPRGAAFMGLAVLVISLFPKRGSAAFGLSASFSLFLAIPLVMPSAIMPGALRAVHFCEIMGSMILYSLVAAALLTRRRTTA